jgi:membrane protein YdbS with pleckstrin-like domain
VADDVLDGVAHQLHPRVRLAWTAAGSVPGLLVAVVAALVSLAGGSTVAALGWLALLGVPWVLGAWGVARWGYARWRWTAWPDALELAHGRVVHRASLVPYHRIQQIDIARGPFARTFGLSTLILRTAAATSDAELPGIDADHAEVLRRELLARAGVDDAV